MNEEQSAPAFDPAYNTADGVQTGSSRRYRVPRAAALVVAALSMTCGTASLMCIAIDGRAAGSCPVFAPAFRGHDQALRLPQAGAATETVVWASIYAAIVDTLYRSHVNATVFHPRGVLRIESLTTAGEAYLGDSAALATLVRRALPESAESLVVAYLSANAQRTWLPQVWMPQAHGQLDVTRLFLDSLTIERFLNTPTADAAAAPLPRGTLVLGDVPAVLSLSKPAIAHDSATALVFALLRTPQSRAPDHLEAASLMILRAKGRRWSVWRELPVP